MKVVQINKDGTMDEIRMRMNMKNTCKQLIKCAKSQGNDSLKELYTWNYENTKIICYSWYDGEAGFENKHDLPPSGISSFLEEDSSTILLFGSLFIVKKSKSNYKDIDVSDYSLFYSECFGGFEDLDDSEDGSEGESDDDNDHSILEPHAEVSD